MEADTDIRRSSGTGSPVLTISENESRSEQDSIQESASELSWADDPDMVDAVDDHLKPRSAMSKKTPSLTGSARFSRKSLADIDHQVNDVRNILITEYGLDAIDDVTCNVSDTESEDSVEASEVDYDTDLEMDLHKWVNAEELSMKDDLSGRKRYLAACDGIGVTPATYFVKHIADQEVAMRFHGLGPQGVKALCVPLKTNSKIEKLDLEGNWLDEGGSMCLADMLRDNLYITELMLSENRIGSAGTKSLCDILMKNDTVVILDLSGNEIKDSAAENICDMLKRNSTLKQLYLSHNHFEEIGAIQFKDALAYNESLETLDLSWNRFRTRGAIYIAEGIQENYGLRTLNFSMNGLGLAGADAMGKALKVNRTLLDLDISFNRIPEEGAGHIAVGLQANDALQTLKISSNPLGSVGALALLVALDRNDSSSMNYLELLNVWVMEDFIQLKDKLETERGVIIIYGGLNKKLITLTSLKGEDWQRWLQNNPMTKIKNYLRESGYRLIDLFRDFDKDGNMSLTKQEFQQGIKAAGIVMTNEQVEELVCKLDKDGNGEVDYRELIEGDKEYRAALRQAAAKRKLLLEAGMLRLDGDEADTVTPVVLKMLNADRTSDKLSVKSDSIKSDKKSPKAPS